MNRRPTLIEFTLAAFFAVVSSGVAGGQSLAELCATPNLSFGGAGGTPVSATTTIVVGQNLNIGDVMVGMNISHDWVADIHLELTSPAGTTVMLQNGDGGSADDIDLIYADAGVPYDSQPFDFGCHMQVAIGSLSVFAGESTMGTWTLTLTDDYPSADDGVLNQWCLEFFATAQTGIPAAPQSLSSTPTADGAILTWLNPNNHAIEVFIDGTSSTVLPAGATSHVITGLIAGTSYEIGLEAIAPAGASSCPVGFTLMPLGPLPEPMTEKLVLVIIDGLRYEDGLGHPTRAFVPEMDALAAEGTIIEPFLCDGTTSTNRAIPAIRCGSWEPPVSMFDMACNENNLFSSRPTYDEYFRQQLGKSLSDCQYIIGPYCPWRGSLHSSYGPAFWPQWVATAGSDNDMWAAAQTVIANDAPDLLTFYLPEVDSAGHSGNWNSYVSAIQNADQIVGDLWDLLQSDPSYAGRTTMIVTNDHGRHWFNFQGHGDSCTGCQTIQFLAIGPPIRRGFVSNTQRTIPDITPTLGALLGFHTEFADGQVMTEIFAQCQQDLGLGGPGAAHLRVCGGDLSPGTLATVYLAGGPSSGTVYAVLSTTFNPVAIGGGTIIDLNPDYIAPLNTTPAGTLTVPDYPGGGGPQTVYLQMVFVDSGLVPAFPHVGFSNAVEVVFP